MLDRDRAKVLESNTFKLSKLACSVRISKPVTDKLEPMNAHEAFKLLLRAIMLDHERANASESNSQALKTLLFSAHFQDGHKINVSP